MSVSKKVKTLLIENEKKQSDLMEVLGMSSKQSLSNKFTNERWSAEDLIKIAEFCGCKLAFVLPNGEKIIFSDTDSPNGARKPAAAVND
jgi:transcriptional regulator with XRE-family HTH domain